MNCCGLWNQKIESPCERYHSRVNACLKSCLLWIKSLGRPHIWHQRGPCGFFGVVVNESPPIRSVFLEVQVHLVTLSSLMAASKAMGFLARGAQGREVDFVWGYCHATMALLSLPHKPKRLGVFFSSLIMFLRILVMEEQYRVTKFNRVLQARVFPFKFPFLYKRTCRSSYGWALNAVQEGSLKRDVFATVLY